MFTSWNQYSLPGHGRHDGAGRVLTVFWWIQSVYVHPDARRQGAYRLLHRHVLELARAAGNVCGIRLYVERHNQRAQETYRRLGMSPTVYELYESAAVAVP
jgi:ribosomal protein S18 acetylase RimI-like enzyme